MNALQLALGSVGAGIQGYSQARTLKEEREAEQERLRKAEARQMAMDLANLQSQGYEAVPDVQRKQQAAIGAAGSMIGSALNAASMPFASTAAGMPSAEAQKYLSQGYAGAKPERTLEYGGQQLALRETAMERQDRLAREQEMRQRKVVEDAANASVQAKRTEQARLDALASDALKGGAKSPSAVRLALESPAAYKAIFEDPNAITPYQRESLALQRERMAYDKTRAAEQDKKAMERVPVSDKRSMNELGASLTELDKAIAAVRANPDAFGLKTKLPNVLLSRTSGTKARADVTGAIVKLRRTEFGTSMSKQEKESGETFFPAGGDNAEAALDKLNSIKEKALIELNAKRSFYGMPEIAPRPDLASFKR
jgi:hypothetical protein